MRALTIAVRLFCLVGVLAPTAFLFQSGGLRADEALPADPATAQAISEREPAPDPEKDTVAIESSAVSDGQTAEVVRIGQGLRPDGTELVPSEVSRPWLIKQ